jgi:hypothetical protein
MQLYRAEEMRRLFGKFLDFPDDAFSWFMILERDDQNRAVQVVVQQMNSDGDVRYAWVAARADRNGANQTATPIAKPPQDVGPPIITPKLEDESDSKKSRQK